MATTESYVIRKYKLDELGFVGRGRSRHRPRNDPSLYGGKYPFIQTGDVKAAGLYLKKYSQTYNDAGLAQSKIWQPGALLITIAANIAETSILGIEACFPDSIVAFVPREGIADARYIKYYIETIKLKMQGISRGTTQDNLSLDKLLSMEFAIPHFAVQQITANKLAAHDELIEENNQRILALEEVARNVYHGLSRHAKSPPTPVSETTSLITRGIAPTYSEGEGSLAINQRCIRDHKIYFDFARHQSKKVPVGKRLIDGDVLINSTGVGTLGRVAQYVANEMESITTDSHVSIVRAAPEINPYFLGAALLDKEEEFERSGTGATGQTELGRDAIGRVAICIPPREVRDEIGRQLKPIRAMISNLVQTNTLLSRARDTLLPRLMTETEVL